MAKKNQEYRGYIAEEPHKNDDGRGSSDTEAQKVSPEDLIAHRKFGPGVHEEAAGRLYDQNKSASHGTLNALEEAAEILDYGKVQTGPYNAPGQAEDAVLNEAWRLAVNDQTLQDQRSKV